MIAGAPERVESARHQWQEGQRRFQSLASQPESRDRLYFELETISDEIRRRIGQNFTLAEAVELYMESESWALDAMAERGPARGWARDLATVLDAAFFLYSRGAVDYLP